MRRIVYGVITGSLMFWTGAAPAWSQGGPTLSPLATFNFYGGGTRAQSMGGAFLGLSDDGSAATWNPAGLTQNDRIYTVLDFGLSNQETTNRLESPESLPFLYDNTTSQSAAQFNFLAFNGPLTLKGHRFHLGASWNRAAYTNYESESVAEDPAALPIDVPPGVQIEGLASSNLVQGGPQYATLAMATQLKEEKLSIGFGLNIYTGSQYDSTRSSIDANDNGFEARQVIDNSDDQSFSGVNFNVGALFQASQYSVGLTVKTPFKLESTHDTRTATSIYERTTDSTLLISENSVLLDYISQFGMPLQVGLGVAFRPQENLILAADYEYKGFANSKSYLQSDLFDPKSDLAESDPELKDVHQIRLGMEYQLGVGWGVVPVRAGFRTEPQPYTHFVDVNESVTTGIVSATQGDQVTGEVYALGTGVQWRQVRFDLGWELSSVTQYTSGYFSGTFLNPQVIRTRENHVQKLSLGFTGYF